MSRARALWTLGTLAGVAIAAPGRARPPARGGPLASASTAGSAPSAGSSARPASSVAPASSSGPARDDEDGDEPAEPASETRATDAPSTSVSGVSGAPPSPMPEIPRSPPLSPAAAPHARVLVVGADLGVVTRNGESDGASYGAGVTYGAWARVETWPWLAFRLGASHASHEVDVARGGLGVPSDTEVHQPAVSVMALSLRVEPTWVVTQRVRAFAGFGLGWARLVAPEPSTTGALTLTSLDRDGTMLEWTLGLGAAYELVPRWLDVGLWAGGATTSNAAGAAFESRQAFDQAGRRQRIGALPTVDGAFTCLFQAGLVL